jgi:hypothetical protein
VKADPRNRKVDTACSVDARTAAATAANAAAKWTKVPSARSRRDARALVGKAGAQRALHYTGLNYAAVTVRVTLIARLTVEFEDTVHLFYVLKRPGVDEFLRRVVSGDRWLRDVCSVRMNGSDGNSLAVQNL